MTSSLAAIALDAVNPRVVADFWCEVLGWVVIEEDEAGISIGSPDGSWPTIDVCQVPNAKATKNRLHFDLRGDAVAQPVELQRMLDLGATPVSVGQPADVSWVVLADPEGNEFCLLSRSVQEVRQG
jgi:Glyoxalase-like domain